MLQSPNIRTPSIRTPEIRDPDSEAHHLDPLLFGSEQSGPNNGMKEVSGRPLAAVEPYIPETASSTAQPVANTQQHAATNIPDPVAQQYDAASEARVPSPAAQNTSGSLDGSWEADLEIQGPQPRQDPAFLQGGARDLESSAQISPEDGQYMDNFEDLLAAPDMNMEQAFLQNGEFNYSAFLGNDGLFEN